MAKGSMIMWMVKDTKEILWWTASKDMESTHIKMAIIMKGIGSKICIMEKV